MTRTILTAMVLLLVVVPGMAADGAINVSGGFGVGEKADRMERVLKKKGMTIVARVNHSEAAAKVGSS